MSIYKVHITDRFTVIVLAAMIVLSKDLRNKETSKEIRNRKICTVARSRFYIPYKKGASPVREPAFCPFGTENGAVVYAALIMAPGREWQGRGFCVEPLPLPSRAHQRRFHSPREISSPRVRKKGAGAHSGNRAWMRTGH